MQAVKKPPWRQATAVVSLSSCGAMTGFTFAHGTVAGMTSPASMPAHLAAPDKPASPSGPAAPGSQAPVGDGALRSAIVSVARHYLTDLTARRPLSVGEPAGAFAAFRWGRLLRRHGVSALEFPYSVAGLTGQHLTMRWPGIDEPHAPDRPGTRFRRRSGPFPSY